MTRGGILMANDENQVVICEVANEGSKRKHILVVDDNPIVLKLIRAYLQDDYKISVVNSGKIAVEFLLKYKLFLTQHSYFKNSILRLFTSNYYF